MVAVWPLPVGLGQQLELEYSLFLPLAVQSDLVVYVYHDLLTAHESYHRLSVYHVLDVGFRADCRDSHSPQWEELDGK